MQEQRSLHCIDCSSIFYAIRSDAQRCVECSRLRVNALARISSQITKYDTCPQCGERKFKRSAGCIHCRNKEWTGTKNPNWKGGRVKAGEYVSIRRQRGSVPYTLEHIAVWEDSNGPLPYGHQVHHLNGVKDDNRLENLYGMSNSDHHRFSGLERAVFESRIRVLEDRTIEPPY